MPTTADHLRDMAHGIERNGLWTGGPNFADFTTGQLDVPAAAYKAATGYLPTLLQLPDPGAAQAATRCIQNLPAAMSLLDVIAEHMARVWPDLDWTDDPIDRLANWPHLLGVTPELIVQTLRDIAHTLTPAATIPAAA